MSEPTTAEALGMPAPLHWFGRGYEDADVLEAARERTRWCYDHFDTVLVSFSGGKDSTAVLNVALEIAVERGRLPLRVVFFDEEAISYETEDYVRRVAELPTIALEWYCLPVRHRNACSDTSPMWWPWASEARELWVRPLPPEAITELEGCPLDPPEARASIPNISEHLITSYDRDGDACILLGIRAQESPTRLRAVSNKREDNWLIGVHPGLTKGYPIYDWRTEDVWTAPARLGWDYNVSYDIMEMSGISHAMQRLAPPFGEEPMRVLSMWAECFPDIWDRLVSRVPGAAAAARYSNGALYGYRQRIAKPAGMSWPEFVQLRISQHPPELRPTVAAMVQQLIRRHYTKTSEPLVAFARHPISGFSWEFIYRLADKGDLKGRRSSFVGQGGYDPEALAKARSVYDAELATFGDGRG